MQTKDALTGIWNGRYEYDVPGQAPVSFVATMADTGGWLTGTIREVPPDGGEAGRALMATLDGAREAATVRFVKRYDAPTLGRVYPIHYQGVLDAEALTIEGRWTIRMGFSGRFTMFRSFGEPIVSAVRARVAA